MSAGIGSRPTSPPYPPPRIVADAVFLSTEVPEVTMGLSQMDGVKSGP